ncbi:MAG: tetratricopeptide repeat protein [Caldilineaceae bacterium]|nr:tetratricopeptide repeat protein [Caldilineaceae bacterium]
MTASLQINLLGTLNLTLADRPLTGLRSQKAIALLVYLACNPGPQRREFLADLLWDASSTAQSLSNLRTVLSRLRAHAGDCLLITPEALSIAPGAGLDLDVAALEAGIASAGPHLSAASASLLAQSLARYRGDFLAGFQISGASGFEQWALIERERLRFLALQSYQRLVDYTLRQGDHTTAIRLATDWLAVDPVDEEAHGQMLRALAYSGQRTAALAHYAGCHRLLAVELDIEPSQKLQELHRQISAGTLTAPSPPGPPVSTPRRNNLPQRLTSFVGRGEELSLVRSLLETPATRLVTLAGEGGVGKSSLALAVGHALAEARPDGVGFASLAEVEAQPLGTLGQRLANALAQSVGLVFSTTPGATEPSVQLFHHLRDRFLLLILDNFEHLTSGLPFITDLLHAAPNCQLLLTSRQPLLVAGESVVRLDGLSVPQENAPLPLPDTAYASIALFIERARQRKHTFTVSAQSRTVLARLCRLVAGNALALELAAAWVEHYSLPEMVAQLEANMLDFLTAPQFPIDERHRSLRHVMETSWRLLDTGPQEMLAQLSIFRGSFHRDAALEVTGFSLDVLVQLVNASLLQQNGAGRYELHEVVRQFAGERLAELPEGGNQSRKRHAHFYLALIGQVGRTSESLEDLTRELANVRHAWAWAVEEGDVIALAGASDGLWNFYLRKGLFQEAEEAFGQAIRGVQAMPENTPGRRQALASLRVAQAVFLNIRSRYPEAIAVAEEAIAFALQEESEAIIARGYLQWGTAHYRQGRYADAITQFQMALMAAQDAGLEGDQADVLRQLGVTFLEQGEFAQAQTHCEKALALYRRTGNRLGEGNTLTDLGWMCQRQQRFEEARGYLEAAERTQTAIDNRHGATIARLNLGIVQQMSGDFSAALDIYQQLFQDLSEQPDRYHHSLVNHSLGVLLSRMGDYAKARHHLMLALEIDRSTGDRGGLAWSYNALGLICNHLGEVRTGLAYHTQALEIGKAQGAATVEGIALLGIGQDMQALGQWAQARSAYDEAIAVQAQLKQNVRVMESRGGLACCLLALDEPAAALAQVEQVLAFLSTEPLLGAAQPALMYWNCYTVLRGLDDRRAPALLAEVFALVQNQASRIRDEQLRHAYLHKLPPHPAIVQEVASLRLLPRFGRVGERISKQRQGKW